MPTTADRIKQMIARHYDIKVNVNTLKDDTHFADHLGADDLVRLDLCYTMEEEFSILLDADQFEFKTVGELIALVERKLDDKLPRAAKKVA
jgi:acyl carrier protein